ncbi:hypothetical protein SGUI_2265 [Serinicoccus hydrothermalis]|uniref:Uncharacterized protein n=1 Tax=Serinicoccus hydrothermalis TaxID=1758689 RepID=A0A1B1NE44_9MICO|nr:hypothetical protein [Serinicoccus hydrothermalis]ANS79661.1 hypothetical protein SGUI_2265 [Serinicoccus hydrothermalis]
MHDHPAAGLHHPFGTLCVGCFEEAGYALTTLPRTTRVEDVAALHREWPLAGLPYVAGLSPALVLLPDDALVLGAPGWRGSVFGVADTGVLVEVLEGSGVTDAQERQLLRAGHVVLLDLQGGVAVRQRVNSSLRAYARCHAAWLEACFARLGAVLAPDEDADQRVEAVLEEFVARAEALDGDAEFWADSAEMLLEMAPGAGCSGASWVGGRHCRGERPAQWLSPAFQ